MASLSPRLREPLVSIANVVERMRLVEEHLPADDGVACFNRLYRAMTEQVALALDASSFEDPTFMARLDLIFASRYFNAVADDLDGVAPPRAWRALFQSRHRSVISPLRFALAGMNAHINFDLALALVATSRERGVPMDALGPQRRDYEQINTVIGRTMPIVKTWFTTGLIGAVDMRLGEVDDLFALFSIVRARDEAWRHAEMLWFLRDERVLTANYIATMDRSVGLLGRSLLCLPGP